MDIVVVCLYSTTGDAPRHHLDAPLQDLRGRRPVARELRHLPLLLPQIPTGLERPDRPPRGRVEVSGLPERDEPGTRRNPAHNVLRVALQRLPEQWTPSYGGGKPKTSYINKARHSVDFFLLLHFLRYGSNPSTVCPMWSLFDVHHPAIKKMVIYPFLENLINRNRRHIH